MVKKRRKLSKEYEKQLQMSAKDIELILAKINDIYDDDIKLEYSIAFAHVKNILSKIKSIYDNIGYTDDSDHMLKHYKQSLNKFKEEYEI